jgi:hypothetical protein
LKEAAKHKFEIMTPGKKKPIVFAAETEGDRKEWVAAIQEAISQSLNSQARLYTNRARSRTHTHTQWRLPRENEAHRDECRISARRLQCDREAGRWCSLARE